MLDFYVKRRTSFSLRDKRLFEILEVEITRVDCIMNTHKVNGSSDMNKNMYREEPQQNYHLRMVGCKLGSRMGGWWGFTTFRFCSGSTQFVSCTGLRFVTHKVSLVNPQRARDIKMTY